MKKMALIILGLGISVQVRAQPSLPALPTTSPAIGLPVAAALPPVEEETPGPVPAMGETAVLSPFAAVVSLPVPVLAAMPQQGFVPETVILPQAVQPAIAPLLPSPLLPAIEQMQHAPILPIAPPVLPPPVAGAAPTMSELPAPLSPPLLPGVLPSQPALTAPLPAPLAEPATNPIAAPIAAVIADAEDLAAGLPLPASPTTALPTLPLVPVPVPVPAPLAVPRLARPSAPPQLPLLPGRLLPRQSGDLGLDASRWRAESLGQVALLQRGLNTPSAALPAALGELMLGVELSQACGDNFDCLMQSQLGASEAERMESNCVITVESGISLSFGAVQGSKPAADWSAESSVAVSCHSPSRFRLQLQDGQNVSDHSEVTVQIGAETARVLLQSEGLPLAEREFISEGGGQWIPITALLVAEDGRRLTPRTAGSIEVEGSPGLRLIESY